MYFRTFTSKFVMKALFNNNFNSFRSRILLSFFTFIFILLSWIAFYFYINMRQKRLQNISNNITTVQNQFSQSNRFLQNFILSGFHDSDFYGTKKQKDIDAFLSYQGAVNTKLSQIISETKRSGVTLDQPLAKLLKLNNSLVDSAQLLKELYFKKGYKDFGAEGRMRNFAHQLEEQSLISEFEILTLRRHEKDFLLRGDIAYADKFNTLINTLISTHQQTPVTYKMLVSYRDNFDELVKYIDQLGVIKNQGVYKNVQNIIEKLIVNFNNTSNAAEREVDQLQGNFTSILIGVSVLLIGAVIFLSLFLSKLLSRDILELNKRMFAFISSDFKEGEIEKQQFVPAISEVNELNKHFSLLKINLKKTIKHLEDSFSEAKTALDYKSSFLANMSHEIRTPLNGVIGMIRILQETPLTVMQADHLQTANYSANHLLDLVNGILDYSKMEAGKMELETIPFNLLDSLQKTMKMFEYKLLEKGLKMKLNFQFSTENMVLGDPTRLQQILINLLNNAIKFTNEGTVTLSVTQLVKYDKYQRLRFSVQDTGIGISKEKIDKLFEAFKQADSSISRNFGGTGLGLTISKQLVNLMNGELMVSSKVDAGSDFYFELDLNVGEKIDRDLLNPKKIGYGVDMYKSLKVLVAEDNLTNQKVINFMLTNAGVSIDFANNGLEACQLYENNSYDIILMDLRMPVMDGLQATKVIVQTKKYKIYNTPIVAVTANAFPEDRKSASEAGMTGFLSKPINPNELKDLLSVCREALKVEDDDLVLS